MFTTTWWGIGNNYGTLNVQGDTTRYVVNWGDGSRDVIRTDQDDDGDDFATTSYGHGYASDGTYDVSIQQSQSGLPPIRLKAFMYGGATNDIIVGGSQLDDIIVGGSGHDMLTGGRGRDTIAGNDGNDTLRGNDGDDFLLGGQGGDLVRGDNGSDLIGGNEGDDRIFGGNDADYLYGDAGNDVISGDDGDDFMQGGAGVDRLTGGAGRDTFGFAPVRDQDGNSLPTDPDRDIVTDFQQGTDRLDVYSWFQDGFSFIGTSRFTGAGDELRFTNTNGATIVFGDADGDKIADFSFRIDGVVALTNADF